MEKTYKFVLPQNKEVEKTNIRIENGEVFVDVEFKEKFQPKDGDFCVDSFGDTFILFEGGNMGINHGSYAIFDEDDEEWYFQRNNMTRAARFATPEEKAAFLARLEKECKKKWNAEKKCLEDIYIPKFGDIVKVCINVEHNGMRNYMICIFPNKPLPTKSDCTFFDIANIDRSGELYYDCGYARSNKIIRASESEKQELYDKLAEAGRRWNPETKQIEYIRWRAEKGQFFYYVYYVDGDLSVLSLQDSRGEVSDGMYKTGNYFRTTEAAKKVADQIKEIFKNSEVE